MSESILFLENTPTSESCALSWGDCWEVIAQSRVVHSFDQLEVDLDSDRVGVVVVALRTHDDFLSLDRALWAASRRARPVPVVALVENYNTADALLCFQMGVTDYLGLREHSNRLGDLLARAASPRNAVRVSARERSARPRPAGRGRRGLVGPATTSLR